MRYNLSPIYPKLGVYELVCSAYMLVTSKYNQNCSEKNNLITMNFYKSICRIFGIESSKTEVFELIKNATSKYLDTLKKIEAILRKGELFGQENVVKNLMQNLITEDYQIFIDNINSVNMWGGSGAVWEVCFENQDLQRKFNFEILELINLMEKTKILGSGIKPLKKLFENEL